MKQRSLVFQFISLLLAVNYFAFQVEPFEDEYEDNHPQLSTTPTITKPTVTWETFDKSNAPKAFVFNTEISFEFLSGIPRIARAEYLLILHLYIIRDKSPPHSISFS
ncbi:MAG TPA: hypothetical protein VFF29_01115 [Bacteroidota bacterium]|nr:hypothetical protein [Bacteroidota bacterium]